MDVQFGSINFHFDVDEEGATVCIERRYDCGFSSAEKSRDISRAVVDAVINVIKSKTYSKADLEIQEFAIEALACAYAAGLTNDFEAVNDNTFVYHGAIYTIEDFNGCISAYRYYDTRPVPLSAFILDDVGKLWMAFAKGNPMIRIY